MLKVMFQRLGSKKWMTLCLVAGIILFVATAVSFPLYKDAALNRMLRDEFSNTISKTGKWPAYTKFNVVIPQKGDPQEIFNAERAAEELYSRMGVTKKETVGFFTLGPSSVSSTMNRDDVTDVSVRIGSYSNLGEHVKILSGRLFSDEGMNEQGEVEVVISSDAMVRLKLLVGESLNTRLKDADGNKIVLKVVGVFAAASSSDFYWQMVSKSANQQIFMGEECFKKLFLSGETASYSCTAIFSDMFDHTALSSDNVQQLYEYTTYMMNEGDYSKSFAKPPYLAILDSFLAKKDRTEATLFMLMIPVLFLVGAFIFMVSGQLYETEGNAISVMKSRGSSTWQILRMFLYQNVFLMIVGCLCGVPLGIFFAKVLGATKSFMEFSASRSLSVRFTKETAIFAAAACLICIIVMTVPAVNYSRVSIVGLKQKKALKKHAFWEKIGLDFICLAIAAYGYYTATRSSEKMAEDVMKGNLMDPVIYISSSMMLVGLGLLLIRLQPLIIRLIYTIGKNLWRPAGYISFTENMKRGVKQQFIMLFMILSVSLGMFHASMARTLLQNAENDADYLSGADIIMKEVWHDNSYLVEEEGQEFTYYEPDYERFGDVEGVSAYTKVLYDNATANIGSKNVQTLLLGVHTRKFGLVTSLPAGLNEKPYREYLNELAVSERGCIVSSSFRDEKGFSIGDNINFTSSDGKKLYCTIVDFVDYWPGFTPSASRTDADGNLYFEPAYLIVTHYGLLYEKWGLQPYEVWMKLEKPGNTDGFYDWVNSQNVELSKFGIRQENLEAVVTDPLLQGTNGILTMGFLVTMLLCSVGYLIFWIMSIRSREMTFGILRAEGMHRSEIFQILINEQIFAGGFSVLCGIGAGLAASKLFVPILQTAYSASGQVLPMQLVTDSGDFFRLYAVIVLALLVCLLVLFGTIRKLDVAKALKMGEE